MNKISIELSPQEHQQIKILAAASFMSIKDFIKLAVREIANTKKLRVHKQSATCCCNHEKKNQIKNHPGYGR